MQNSWRDHACQISGPKGREKSAVDHLLSIGHGRPLDCDDLAIMAGDTPGSPLIGGEEWKGPPSLAGESPEGYTPIELGKSDPYLRHRQVRRLLPKFGAASAIPV